MAPTPCTDVKERGGGGGWELKQLTERGHLVPAAQETPGSDWEPGCPVHAVGYGWFLSPFLPPPLSTLSPPGLLIKVLCRLHLALWLCPLLVVACSFRIAVLSQKGHQEGGYFQPPALLCQKQPVLSILAKTQTKPLKSLQQLTSL